MLESLRKVPSAYATFRDSNGRRYANLETNRDCNRSCSYCMVPQQYKQSEEATLAENFTQIDWLHSKGFRVMGFLGGEPLAPFRTKENITFEDHTVEVVKHASDKGMIVNVTTNGDFLNENNIQRLKKAGLDSIQLSLHTKNKPGLEHLIKGGKLAARAGIIPSINVVFTTDIAERFPAVAGKVAENGLLFSTSVVQEKGGGLSSTPEDSAVPTADEQKSVFDALLRLKNYGFVRNNRNYLTHAVDYPNNSWTCDPEKDNFLHIGAGGTLDVCSDVRTDIKAIDMDLESDDWRELKRKLVKNCGDCLYNCFYESQNPNILGDASTYMVMMMIRTGHAETAERFGKFAVGRLRKKDKTTNWNLEI